MCDCFDPLGAIIAYEAGQMSEDQEIEFFQHLVDTGIAWKLQGHYGRAAQSLLDAGLIHIGGEQHVSVAR